MRSYTPMLYYIGTTIEYNECTVDQKTETVEEEGGGEWERCKEKKRGGGGREG